MTESSKVGIYCAKHAGLRHAMKQTAIVHKYGVCDRVFLEKTGID